jgi:hypothetical protein
MDAYLERHEEDTERLLEEMAGAPLEEARALLAGLEGRMGAGPGHTKLLIRRLETIFANVVLFRK